NLDRLAVGGYEQVARFNVPMHQPSFLGMLQAECRLANILAGLLHPQWAVLLDQPSQVRGSLDVLHDQQVPAADVVGVIGQHDIGMIQRGCRLNFSLETSDDAGVIEPVFANQLDSSDAAQVAMAGLEDLAHAALTELVQHDIGSEDEFVASALEQIP